MELLEIEKELKGADRAAALERHDAVLVGLQSRLREAMREGLAPESFESCKMLDEAVVVARKLLRIQVKDCEGF